jgi:EpsI family protein
VTAGLGWAPAAVLVVGAVLATAGVKAQRALPLRAPLADAVPREIDGLRGRDGALSGAEARAVAATSYLVRAYESAGSTHRTSLSLYVGYYDRQTQGRTIHSPRNCLPGAGWEPVASRPDTIQLPGGPITVNRYLLQRKIGDRQEQALVLYWYQGRGRVAWNEYLVKWDLLRDAALRRRSDEALVRIVVPIARSEADAARLARDAAGAVAPALARALPG